ncbi:hypothetical protein GF325_06790 [Candidatus Bathyarchaeota archaeon]|nr:hypothetical protein [Candidatus Bathyarchaeota archaeon]
MDPEREFKAVDSLDGVTWKNGSRTEGFMQIAKNVEVHFNFNQSPPLLKIKPRKARKALPPVIDILPELTLWEMEDAPSWSETLEKLRNALLSALHEEMDDDTNITLSIDKRMVEGLLASARDAHPDEVIFLLRRDRNGSISEAILPQGAAGGKTLAYIVPSRLPFDPSLEGSFHSHPSGNCKPSEQDIELFKRYKINIIGCNPYRIENLGFYDNLGDPIDEISLQ